MREASDAHVPGLGWANMPEFLSTIEWHTDLVRHVCHLMYHRYRRFQRHSKASHSKMAYGPNWLESLKGSHFRAWKKGFRNHPKTLLAENTRFGCSLLLLAYLSITPLATIISAHLCWFPCPCPVILAIFRKWLQIDCYVNEKKIKKINQRKTRARDATTRTNNPHNTNQKSCIRTEIMVRVVGRMPLYSWNHNNANILHTCEWMLYVCVVLC